MYIALMPPPTENISLIFQATDGLMFTVMSSDLIAWNRPTQPASHSVVKPNGAPTPIPAHSSGVSCHERYPLIGNPQSPASPPLFVHPFVWSGGSAPGLVAVVWVHGWFPPMLNLAEGLTAVSAPTTCRPGSRVIPAGLNQIVLASSATAAWPE